MTFSVKHGDGAIFFIKQDSCQQDVFEIVKRSKHIIEIRRWGDIFRKKTGRAKNSLPSSLNYIVKTDLLIFIESSLAGHQAKLYRKLGTGAGGFSFGFSSVRDWSLVPGATLLASTWSSALEAPLSV